MSSSFTPQHSRGHPGQHHVHPGEQQVMDAYVLPTMQPPTINLTTDATTRGNGVDTSMSSEQQAQAAKDQLRNHECTMSKLTNYGSTVPGDFEIENCSLIEKPEQTNGDLKHTLLDCIGYCTRLPLRAPNCDHEKPETIAEKANEISGNQIAFACRCCGSLVPPNCIGIYVHNGMVKVVSPGRWLLRPSRSHWQTLDENLDKNVIKSGTLLVVRVPIGQIGLCLDNGNPLLLGPGSHCCNTGLVQFQRLVDQSAEYISHGPFHLLRVPRGKYGKCWVPQKDTGTISPRLLEEGFHIINNVLFRFDGMVDVRSPHIEHGSVHVLQVEKGKVAKVFLDNIPRLLGPGRHALESVNFQYCGVADMTDQVIRHGTITILRIPLGEIGLAWQLNEPFFIESSGLYAYNSPDFTFVDHVPANEKIIELGAKKILSVWTGEVGITYRNGELDVLDHGRHVIDAATHVFECFLSTQQKSLRLVSMTQDQKKKRAQTRQAAREQYEQKAAAAACTAKKPPGNVPHFTSGNSDALVDTATGVVFGGESIFSGAFNNNNGGNDKKDSAGNASANKDPAKSENRKIENNDRADMLACETKDLVKVGIRADVFYSICDPIKCCQKISYDEIEDLVRETAIATLTNIVRSTALNEIAQSKLPSAVSSDLAGSKNQELQEQIQAFREQHYASASAPLFFDKAHDDFLSKLHDDFYSRYGIDIANIRIESFQIFDEELAESISRQALVTAQTENQLANLAGQTEIAIAEQKRIAEVQNISAEAEAQSLRTRANAENERRIQEARSQAEAKKIAIQQEAQAFAEAKITKARAEAEAVQTVAVAEAKRAELLNATPLGSKMTLLNIHSEMVKECNRGVEKIIYCDPTLQGTGSAFALQTLQSLNMDLNGLSLVGEHGGAGKGNISPKSSSTTASSTQGSPILDTASSSTRASGGSLLLSQVNQSLASKGAGGGNKKISTTSTIAE
ncbi:unnamed protein product [Amoebophrya sp. A120]|nr:unnamed protein product [Amoebophrya sp. A120]|eukprot:GSA120T00003912001.1